MRILLTGSSGRIGSVIARHLAASGHAVVGIDRAPAPQTAITADLTTRDVSGDVAGCDGIVHCAALHAPHVGAASESAFRAINVAVTQRLLDAALEHGVGRFVLTSSTSIYGDALAEERRASWIDESVEPRPRDIYDETKQAAEALCLAVGNAMAVTSLRMSRCFPESPELMAAYRLYRGVDARDVAEAHARALLREDRGFSVYNVSAPSPFRREDVEALWLDAAGVIRRRCPWAEAEFASRGWALPQRIDRVYVTEGIRAGLGFKPRHGLRSLLAEHPTS
ncbi:MAG: NAD(P)-dependent oxidoreductase [Pseudomonadota bacterium]